MAMSVQACLPNNCKSQHQMKAGTKSPNVVRRTSMRQYNAANRKSAVERLEESKANYVKSERVLDTRQEFKNSSHLRISSGAQLDLLYKASTKNSPEYVKVLNSPDDMKLSYLRLQQQNNIGNLPTPRPRTKSHSEYRDSRVTRKHSFASQQNRHRIEVLIDIESQLKRLITTGSKENISTTHEPVILDIAQRKAQLLSEIYQGNEVPKVRRGYSDPIKKNRWAVSAVSASPDVCIHKSMPDLSPSPYHTQHPSSCVSPANSNGMLESEPSKKTALSVATSKQKTCDSPKKCYRDVEESVSSSPPEPRRFTNETGKLHLTPYYSASNQLQRRPVSRSKSDVSHRYSKRASEHHPRRNNYTSAEIERFFDTMGLDTNAWHHITSPSSISSPPCFFESVSSADSNEDKCSNCSEESVPEEPREGLRNKDLRVHGPLETSIVEKNARVIKWLYNCRKAACDT